jgi:energy-coupling factor transport system permease protein
VLGQGTRRSTWLHAVEPRAKLVAAMAFVAMAFLVSSTVALASVAVVLGGALWWVGGAGRLGRRLLAASAVGYPVAWLVFTASYWDRGQTALSNMFVGLHTSSEFALRLLVIILANLLLMATTDPRQFARSLRGWRVPGELCLMFMTVLRFLPLAAGEVRRILDAQRCRGFRMRRLWRPDAWLPVSVPVLVSTLHRAEGLAMSLELRGFRSGIASLAPSRPWSLREYLFTATSVVVCTLLALMR